jgi:cation diffusion facilitator family transporter
VLTALGANLGVAAAKFTAAAITGSVSMLAEGVHSVADSGNQVLLLVGGRRSRQAPSALHPFGYARERYIYAFLVAVVLFTLGGLYALYEGYHKVIDPHPLTSPLVAVAVLLVAMALEGDTPCAPRSGKPTAPAAHEDGCTSSAAPAPRSSPSCSSRTVARWSG